MQPEIRFCNALIFTELPATRQRAFTLIELLVVVSIIVVLLALLTPALDKAIYQAELMSCATTQRGFGQQITMYAMDHRRNYPHRPAIDDGAARHSLQMTNPAAGGANLDSPRVFDDRKPIEGYVAINAMLNCPLAEDVDLEVEEPLAVVYADYGYYYNWRYRFGGQSYKGMKRLGDRFTGPTTDPTSSDTVIATFDIIAGDYDFAAQNDSVQQTHPDRGANPRLSLLVDDYAMRAPVYVTRSVWSGRTRDVVDMNFVKTDQSVQRVTSAEFRDTEQLVELPAAVGNSNPYRIYLPKR